MLTSCNFFENIFQPQVVWSVTLDSDEENIAWPSTPVYLDGRVYIITSTHFYEIDSSNGTIIWKLKYTKNYTATPGVKPLIDKKRNLAYFSGGGYIRCIDLNSRSKKWSQYDLLPYTNIPVLYNDELYIQDVYNGIYVLEPETGKILRFYDLHYDFDKDGRIEPDGNDKTTIRNNKPVFKDNTMFVNSIYYTIAMDISNPTGEATVSANDSIKWIALTGAASMPPLLYNNELYVAGNASLYKLDIETGEKLWKGTSCFNVGPAYSKGKIISATESFPARAFAIDITTNKEIWHTEPFEATPGGEILVCKEKVYIATMGSYFCIDENNGKILWELKESVYAPDNKGFAYSMRDNLIYIPDEVKGRLIAIKSY